jgi:NAD(P)-dependent dehydrogenase (short-subunit alcohol dehydrogenase family)
MPLRSRSRGFDQTLAPEARRGTHGERGALRIDELFDVRGLVVIVTGGAGGIGFGIAEALADNGAKVLILDKDSENLSGSVERLRGRGGAVEGKTLDVFDADALKTAVDDLVAREGRLDVAFANAGINGGPGFLGADGKRNQSGALDAVSDDLWDAVIDADLMSVVAMLKAAAPHMKRQRRGRIIVTTSVAAAKTENFVGYPYIAAKAASAHLVRQAALELARFNVTVNAIAPGPFRTRIGGNRMADPLVRRAFESAPLLHRMASPEEIQGLALLLASPASSYITGAQLAIDGGALAGHIAHGDGAID